jgi:hypothetical protein
MNFFNKEKFLPRRVLPRVVHWLKAERLLLAASPSPGSNMPICGVFGTPLSAGGSAMLAFGKRLTFRNALSDEKMHRVVMDRDRWFKVFMGEKYKVDAKTTEKLAERIPLQMDIAERLAFKLFVV